MSVVEDNKQVVNESAENMRGILDKFNEATTDLTIAKKAILKSV